MKRFKTAFVLLFKTKLKSKIKAQNQSSKSKLKTSLTAKSRFSYLSTYFTHKIYTKSDHCIFLIDIYCVEFPWHSGIVINRLVEVNSKSSVTLLVSY